MACMASMKSYAMAHSVQGHDRVKELEDRVEKLESLIERLMKSDKPSFQDFKFLKDEDDKKEREELERESAKARRMSRAMMSRDMFMK